MGRLGTQCRCRCPAHPAASSSTGSSCSTEWHGALWGCAKSCEPPQVLVHPWAGSHVRHVHAQKPSFPARSKLSGCVIIRHPGLSPCDHRTRLHVCVHTRRCPAGPGTGRALSGSRTGGRRCFRRPTDPRQSAPEHRTHMVVLTRRQMSRPCASSVQLVQWHSGSRLRATGAHANICIDATSRGRPARPPGQLTATPTPCASRIKCGCYRAIFAPSGSETLASHHQGRSRGASTCNTQSGAPSSTVQCRVYRCPPTARSSEGPVLASSRHDGKLTYVTFMQASRGRPLDEAVTLRRVGNRKSPGGRAAGRAVGPRQPQPRAQERPAGARSSAHRCPGKHPRTWPRPPRCPSHVTHSP